MSFKSMSDKYHPKVKRVCIDCKQEFEIVANHANTQPRCKNCHRNYRRRYLCQIRRERGLNLNGTQPRQRVDTDLFAAWALESTVPIEINIKAESLRTYGRIGSKRTCKTDNKFIGLGERLTIHLILPGRGHKKFLCAVSTVDKKCYLVPDDYFDWSLDDFEPFGEDETKERRRLDYRSYERSQYGNITP